MEVGLIGLRGLPAVRSVFTIDAEHAQIRPQVPAADTASDLIWKPGIARTDFVKVRSS